jgi:DNA sulfur modification protein DndC
MNNIENINEINELIAQGAIFFVGHSGGKDSQAMFAALTKIVPADQLHVVHADLGEVEHLNVKSFIRSNIDGKDLHVAQAIHADGSPKDFFSMVRARRVSLDSKGKTEAPAFPSSAARFCTSDLKTGPIWKVIRQLAGDAKIVVNCVGIRGEESPARAKRIATRGSLMVNTKNTNSKRDAFDYWPIASWKIDQVWAEIAEKGQERHPAYDAGNDRLSCAFCIFGSQGDLSNAAAQRPELLAKFTQLETDVRSTMFNGSTLADKALAKIAVRIQS